MFFKRWFSLFPKPFWFALAGGCLLRLWVVAHNPVVGLPVPTVYSDMAANFTRFGTLGFSGATPSAFRLPGYPLLIAAVFKLTGGSGNLAPVLALNLLLMAATVFLAYRLARRVATERQALAAAWLLAINPALIPLNFDCGIETTFTLLLTILAWTLVRLVEEPESSKRWAFAGAAIGVGLTVRSTFLVFPILLSAATFLALPRRPTFARIALLCVCAYVFVVPWTVRNWMHFGRIVPFEDGMGWHTLFQGSVSVEGIVPDTALPEPMRTYYFNFDPRIGPVSKELALANIRRSPGRYALNCIGRLRTLWFSAGWAEVLFNATDGFNDYRARGEWLFAATKAAAKLIELSFIGLMLWGAFFNLRSPPLALLALVGFYMNIHVLTMGLPRYTAPLLPIMSLFAVLGACDLASRWRRRA